MEAQLYQATLVCTMLYQAQCSFQMFTTLPILYIAAAVNLCTPYAAARLYSALNCSSVSVSPSVQCTFVCV